MDGLSLWFLDIWTFAFSQLGIFALGYIFGASLKREFSNLIDKIDGQPTKVA